MDKQAQSSNTRLLLTLGILAGPLYVGIGILEGVLRKGFSFTHHDLSILANGDFGWIHSGMLMLTGLMTILATVGMRRVLKEGLGGKWGTRLLALYGTGLFLAGIFRADPAHGFPQGTPADAPAVSWHGGLHLLFGSIGFLGLIIACFALARRFKAAKEKGWTLFSRFTGTFYLFAFIGIAIGSNGSGAALSTVILLFSAAVVLGWAWVTAASYKLRQESGTS